MTLLLRGGRVIDPRNGVDRVCDLLIRDGVVGSIDAGPGIAADRTIDCDGQVVTPGLIDLHVHLREPGFEYKEDLQSGLTAAVAAGFTGVCPMPNTRPISDSRPDMEFLIREARRISLAQLWPVGAVTQGQEGQQLTEFGQLRKGGAVALSDDGRPISNSMVMRRSLEYALKFELPIFVHAEDPGLSGDGAMNEGLAATRMGLSGTPCAAESAMVARDIQIAALTGGRVHFLHVSCARSVELIRMAKAEGIAVTAETCPHYWELTDEAVDGYRTDAKMYPPLRAESDRAAVRVALADGVIDTIGSDHAPHAAYEKALEFRNAPNGIIGLETTVPLALNLVRDGVIDWQQFVRYLSVNPAAVIGVDRGHLSPGAVADVTVIDPRESWVVERATIRSKSINTPFLGATVTGRATACIIGGRVLMEAGGLEKAA